MRTGTGYVDRHGNRLADEGCDRCPICGCKYWEGDRCIDCRFPLALLN